VQVDPMKPKLKPPGPKRLKLMCDILLSTFAFKFNLRRCSKVVASLTMIASVIITAGAYTRSHFSST